MEENKNYAKITGIFPTPVYQTTLFRNLNSKELSFIEDLKNNKHKNTGNYNSANTYVLNENSFLDLKKELQLVIDDYFDKIITPGNKIKPFITQSWLNWTKEKEHHHKHNHSNSLVSGVFYINADEEYDKIKFFKSTLHDMIKIEASEYHLFNSDSWWFPVKTGDIILFPSSLTHMVESKEGNNLRTSLAFNVFIKGTLGVAGDMTELKK